MSFFKQLLRRVSKPEPPKSKRAIGQAAEDAAARCLAKQGYKILQRNYRCPLGEIDLIAEQGSFLIFVEVKARSTSEFGTPAEAVTKRKRRRLTRLARHYLAFREHRERDFRFDIAEVYLNEAGRAEQIVVIQNAFDSAD